MPAVWLSSKHNSTALSSAEVRRNELPGFVDVSGCVVALAHTSFYSKVHLPIFYCGGE